MEIIYFLFIGLIIGWLAGLIVKGRGFGILGDIIVGIIGSFVGGFLARLLGVGSGTSLGALLISVAGAVVFLLIVKLVKSA